MHSTLAHGILRPHLLTFPVQHNGVDRQRTCGRTVQAYAAVDAGGDAENHVLVIGGGIGGLAAAVGLTRVGLPVTVLERAPHLREAGACIMMQSNGWRALEALGVADELRSRHSMKVERMEAYVRSGKRLKGVEVADCANGPHELRGVVRNDLQSTLASRLPEGVIRTNVGITGVSHFDDGPIVELEDGSRIKAKVVVGADGVMSKVGASLGLSRPQYAGWSAFRGMADFKEGLPDATPAFRIVLGGPEGMMVGTYPVSPTRAYYFVCGPAPEDFVHRCKDKAVLRAELQQRVQGLPLHMEAVVAHTPDEHLYLSVVGDRKVAAGEPLGRGCVTVIGDAAHPTTPALGQGGCMALEDAVDVAATLRHACSAGGSQPQDMAKAFAAADPTVIAEALRAMERRRTARCAPLVQMAHDNAERTIMPNSLPAVWLRDFWISNFGLDPKTQLEYTVGWEASVL